MLTIEQKAKIRKELKSVTLNRVGFVKWMIRIFKALP